MKQSFLYIYTAHTCQLVLRGSTSARNTSSVLRFGFSVHDGFESQKMAKIGVLEMPAKGERMQGGHAVMAVGYDDKAERLIVRNSLGEDWGQKGYFTMPYAYVIARNLSDDFGTIRRGERM